MNLQGQARGPGRDVWNVQRAGGLQESDPGGHGTRPGQDEGPPHRYDYITTPHHTTPHPVNCVSICLLTAHKACLSVFFVATSLRLVFTLNHHLSILLWFAVTSICLCETNTDDTTLVYISFKEAGVFKTVY